MAESRCQHPPEWLPTPVSERLFRIRIGSRRIDFSGAGLIAKVRASKAQWLITTINRPLTLAVNIGGF